MIIATTYQAGQIFQHFGHTKQFKLYQVEDGNVVSMTIVNTGESGHGALASFLANEHVDVLICGGIGGGAQSALAGANIRVYGGVSGDTDYAVAAFLAGKLDYNPNVQCSHHDHQHSEGHTCSDHGCGDHCQHH